MANGESDESVPWAKRSVAEWNFKLCENGKENLQQMYFYYNWLTHVISVCNKKHMISQ